MPLVLLALLACRNDPSAQDSVSFGLCRVYVDADADGYGLTETEDWDVCDPPAGLSLVGGDCDDADPAIHPEASEVCDGVDNQCDGLIDDADPALDPDSLAVGWLDTDGDGFGDAAAEVAACVLPAEAVADDQDCDDTDASVYPGAEELCDGVDTDCDGSADEDFPDADGDALADCVDVCPVYAAPDQSAQGDGSEANPYASVGDAIALRGSLCDDILLLPGTYAEAVDFGGEALSITSVEGAERTVIDATGLGAPAVTIEGVEGGLLEGVTLTGGEGRPGDGASLDGFPQGGFDAERGYGGGLYVRDASPALRGLILEENHVTGFGGGLLGYGFSGALEDSVIRGNSASGRFFGGGGVWLLDSEAQVLGCRFEGNEAPTIGASGGGLTVLAGAPQVLGNVFVANEADATGAGAYLDAAGGLFANNVLSAHPSGAALAVNGAAAVDVLHNTLDGNYDGLFVDGSDRRYPSGSYLNNLITRSVDDGVDAGWYACINAIRFDHNDVWGSGGADYSNATCQATVTGGAYANLSVDPLYADPEAGDWSLQADSPVRDAGEDASAWGLTQDITGAARPQGDAVSMGAYER